VDKTTRVPGIIRRLNANGTNDASFGNGRAVRYAPFSNVYANIYAIEVQNDGKILISGTTGRITAAATDSALLIRLLPNGVYDSSFGTNGVAKYTVPANSLYKKLTGTKIKVLNNGKILLVMEYTDSVNQLVTTILQCNVNGSVDTNFGTQGLVPISSLITGAVVSDIDIQSSGKIIIEGIMDDIVNLININFLARLTANGVLDSSFGTNGIDSTTYIAGATGNVVTGLSILPNDNILLGGSAVLANNTDVVVYKYNVNGGLNNTFGTNGYKIIDLYPNDYSVWTGFQSDGKIITAGEFFISGNRNLRLTRINSNGSIDAGFGTNGFTTTPLPVQEPILEMDMQADNKVVGITHWAIDTVVVYRFLTAPGVGTLNPEITAIAPTVFPNPISEATSVQYDLIKPESITITLHDILGNTVATFINNQTQAAGNHTETLNLPQGLPAGAYLITVSTNETSRSVRVVKE
jgi:uncharacterized delta-60 repeat protein